ncbi:hypothetical protein SAMN05421796_11511 [Chryseobacterium piscicola]|uniref:Uncharacterized protein n=1 Tax=Chryseobacterium piscicola TaxID=551459 RepID=A0A1N7PH35_9FLAO|nr:hypothetical protein SAMN05421796_11511 [Chryseobacterium piscicola]
MVCCCVSQRYLKMKAIHNYGEGVRYTAKLLCIPKILKNESNSQLEPAVKKMVDGCCVSQRYLKMKAIHN